MKKRILSIFLAISMVASLFSCVNFIANATDGLEPIVSSTEYTYKTANGVSTEFPANTSLIEGKSPSSQLWLNTSNTNLGTFTEPKTFTLDSSIDNLTKASSISGQTGADVKVAANTNYQQNWFVKYDSSNKAIGLVDKEDEQFVQLNYTLDGTAALKNFIVASYKGGTPSCWTPSHFKLILSETEEGLTDLTKAKAVIEVEQKEATCSHIVTLNNAIKAKYVGLRIICMYSDFVLDGKTDLTAGTFAKSSMHPRITNFTVHGNYLIKPETTVAASAKGANVKTESSLSLSGITDAVGNHTAGTVSLTAEQGNVDIENGKKYSFEGWYLGDKKIADTLEATYALDGTEGTQINFVAKYIESDYDPNTDFVYTVLNLKQTGDFAPGTSLINKKMPSSYWYLNTENTNAGKISDDVQTFTLNSNVSRLTDSDTLSAENDHKGEDAEIFDTKSKQANNMFITTNDSGKVIGITDDETKQYVQLNYTLDGVAALKKLVVASYRQGSTSCWTPSHFKLILSETEEGLTDLTKANAVLDVKQKEATCSHIVTLNNAIKAKYVGLRIICMYNDVGNTTLTAGTFDKANVYPRITNFTVHGEYLIDPATKVYASTEGADVEASAQLTLSELTDAKGNHASGTVALATQGTFSDTENVKHYEFDGWYLGENKVADTANATYTLDGSEGVSVNFVAKYKVYDYIPYDKYEYVGKNGVDGLANQSLIKNKMPTSVQVLNTEEVISGIGTEATPQTITANSNTKYLTDPGSINGQTGGDPVIFPKNNDMSKHLFVDVKDGKVVGLTDDETKQYLQLNYSLDSVANIDKIVIGTYRGGGTDRWIPKHYKIIVSDTVEGLTDLKQAKAVIEYDMSKVEVFSRHDYTFTDGIEGKYIAVRYIQPYNDICGETLSNGTFDAANLYIRTNYIGVYGTYTNPANAEVTIATEDGVPSSLISKADAVYTGNADTNNNYAAGSVKVTATESYEDKENLKLYTFKGWYNGETIVSANAEYTYDLTGGDITLTAKYDVDETTVKYTLTFVDASKTVVGTIVVEEGKTVDMALVNAIEVKDIYGYKVQRDEVTGYVVWDKGFDEAITADATYTACYKAIEELKTTVTVYDVDGSKYIDNREVRFDSQINLVSTKGAEYWADAAGNVLVGAPTGKIYACGTTMQIYAKTGEFEAPAVVFVGKEMKDGKFTVFVHAAPTAEVKAYGIIFASNTYKLNYDAQGENTGDMFTLKDTAAINKENPSLKVSEVKVTTEGVVDFMATLNGCGGKVRHARAYVTYTDGTTVYSDVIVTNN